MGIPFEIGRMMRAEGLKVVAATAVTRWSIDEAETFYGEHRGRFFYPRLVAFMTSGPLIALVLEREDAISTWRKLMGPTHCLRAKSEAPNSIRGRFASSDTRNVTHGSDSEENARKEIEFFFPGFSFHDSTWEPQFKG